MGAEDTVLIEKRPSGKMPGGRRSKNRATAHTLGIQKMTKIKIKNGTLNQALNKLTKSNKIGWSMSDQGDLVDIILSSMSDVDGKSVTVSEESAILVKVTLSPTEEIKRTALDTVFKKQGYELVAETASTLALLFNPTAFGEYLASTINPNTGEKFITKPEKRQKKARFTALLSQTGTGEGSTEVSQDAVGQPTKAEDKTTVDAAKAA